MVEAWATSAVSSPATLASRRDASRAPPELGRGPVSDITVVIPRTVARTTVAWPLKLFDDSAMAELVAPAVSALVVGQNIRPTSNRLSVTELQHREVFLVMIGYLDRKSTR